MSERRTVALELLCIVVVAFGVAVIYWPAALIVGGGLGLIGLQGANRNDRTAD